MMLRRAKIVATLGPATSTYEKVRALIDAGVDVARLNLSHGDYSVHEANYSNVRRAAEDSGRAVAILVDLQGPKIRLGRFEDGPYELEVGDIFKITTEDIIGNREICGTTFKGLPNDVKPGDFLLIDDGKVRVEVVETDGTVVTTKVIVAGAVSKGRADRGILLTGSGIGTCLSSNKFKGVRAVVGYDQWSAEISRAHHDCNVLCLPADLVGPTDLRMILTKWLDTEFEGGRHERRLRKVRLIEDGQDPQTYREG